MEVKSFMYVFRSHDVSSSTSIVFMDSSRSSGSLSRLPQTMLEVCVCVCVSQEA